MSFREYSYKGYNILYGTKNGKTTIFLDNGKTVLYGFSGMKELKQFIDEYLTTCA